MLSLDENTLKLYQRFDRTRHTFKNRQAGTNFTPIHPLCRSTHFDNIPNALYGYRASRKNGKLFKKYPVK